MFTNKAERGATEGKGSYAEVAGVPRHPFWCNKIKMPAPICTSHTCCPQGSLERVNCVTSRAVFSVQTLSKRLQLAHGSPCTGVLKDTCSHPAE